MTNRSQCAARQSCYDQGKAGVSSRRPSCFDEVVVGVQDLLLRSGVPELLTGAFVLQVFPRGMDPVLLLSVELLGQLQCCVHVVIILEFARQVKRCYACSTCWAMICDARSTGMWRCRTPISSRLWARSAPSYTP